MRRGFTLMEIVTVVAISGILAAGTFKALSALYIRSMKARAVTELSLSTQAVVDQLSLLLYARVPASVIGYDPADGSYAPLGELAAPKPVLEWLGTAEEAQVARAYSGFVDMNASDPVANRLRSPDTDGDALDAIEKLKFGTAADTFSDDRLRLLFAGTFDSGGVEGAFDEAFGWHGGSARAVYAVAISGAGDIDLSGDPAFIYEKYYLADTAYAVARTSDVDTDAQCLEDAGIDAQDDTLLLFFDYRPWKGETFCADPRGSGQSGRVVPLAEHISGFRAELVNYTIRLSVDATRPIKGSTPVRLSKQKVVF